MCAELSSYECRPGRFGNDLYEPCADVTSCLHIRNFYFVTLVN